jgi:hypothetical protein
VCRGRDMASVQAGKSSALLAIANVGIRRLLPHGGTRHRHFTSLG